MSYLRQMVQVIKEETSNNIKLVKMLADEYSREEIASVFGTTVFAISKRIYRLMVKYDCKTNVGLVVLFYKNKLIK